LRLSLFKFDGGERNGGSGSLLGFSVFQRFPEYGKGFKKGAGGDETPAFSLSVKCQELPPFLGYRERK